jgi:hypothetical protein
MRKESEERMGLIDKEEAGEQEDQCRRRDQVRKMKL